MVIIKKALKKEAYANYFDIAPSVGSECFPVFIWVISEPTNFIYGKGRDETI